MRSIFQSLRAAGRGCKGAIGALVWVLSLAPAAWGAGGLTISDAWVRFIIPARPAAGYFTLHNTTANPASLVKASSPDCGMLMLHKTVNENGRESMVGVESVPVPAHGSVSFAPGGYHLMCMQPSAAVKRGNSIPVTLSFDDGGTLKANFPVRGPTGD
jgi:periplasmic copper chaperone A